MDLNHALRFTILSLSLSWGCLLSAQNLVPNPSFEMYDTCPDFFNQWFYLTDWESPFTMSADYFNACSDSIIAGVPLNHFGYQNPSDGNGYAGIINFLYNVPLVRELLIAELDQPLQTGVPVHISFKTAVGGFGSSPLNSAVYTAKGVGIKFFVQPPTNWIDYLYPNSAALYLDEVPTDTSIWYSVSGSYLPDSAYTFIALGNFFEDSLSDPTILDSTGYGNLFAAYSFLDEICVSEDPTDCGIFQSIGENELRGMKIVNPVSDRLIISFTQSPSGILNLRLFNANGQMCWQVKRNVSGTRAEFSLPILSDGICVLTASDSKAIYKTQRILIFNE